MPRIGPILGGPSLRSVRRWQTRASTAADVRCGAGWNGRRGPRRPQREHIHVAGAVDEIHRAVRDEEWVLTNTGSLTVDGWVKKLWPLERPGSYLGLNGGGGLGYSLGASVGAALAHRDTDTLCIDLQSDGDFLYTPSALWTLGAQQAPLLVVVMNNRLYLNSTQHAERIAGNRDRDIDRAHIATSFYDNPADFVTMARSYGIHALPRVERSATSPPPSVRRSGT